MKPILFNTDMVRGILEDRKTVMRRVVKQQHLRVLDSPYHQQHPETPDKVLLERLCMPPYRLGDALYVREAWRIWRAHRYDADAHIEFKAGGEGVVLRFPNGCTDSANRDDYDRFIHKWGVRENKWHPSIHMPREAARVFLRVTDVRVERLQDIKCSGVVLEGVLTPPEKMFSREESLARMKKAWNSTIKKADYALYGWEANPWVFVIEFERISKEEAMVNED